MIKEITYEYIWSEVIKPTIERIKLSVKDEISSKYHFNHRDLLVVKNSIFELYEEKRDRIKDLFHFDDGKEKSLIDIHKIAACFASILIENPVFEYSMEIDSEIPDNIFLANAELAYYVSLGIIYIGLIYDYTDIGLDNVADELIRKGKLFVPPTNVGHDEYNLGRIKTLALNDLFDNEFDILTYSDMMFWIEFYNRQQLEQTLNPRLINSEKK